ncbi:unnamed protein product [Candidula unifasciata]|uniref:Glycoprotein-N-acetylgalactosamine 3-beta-galactosyltransferase 1 n=1 Tax=Candidula unifasciata TaxID=100452 RepID=A0A8S3ZSE1_9EUPU|nr:unnamed protein product [Candidula unifasciata]
MLQKMPAANRQFFIGLAVGHISAFVLISFNVLAYIPVHFSVLQSYYEDIYNKTDFTSYDDTAKMSNNQVLLVNDVHMHNDNDSVARKLKEQVRVLIWVLTSPANMEKRATAVKNTWARRCNKILFFSSKDNATFPAIGLNVPEGREHLTAKTMKAVRYIYEHHFDDADWFMKADDDTYVIVENLRYFLSGQNTSEPVFFGHHFKLFVKQGYYSGGGGYVLSKEALRRLGPKANDSSICRQDGGSEDVELGRCMEKLGVRTAESIDSMNRSRFHCFDPETHLSGNYHVTYAQYDSHGAKKGPESISDYAISFHTITPQKMQALDFYIYHLKPYGINSGNQDLNRREDKDLKH